jgi:hypothetical protein
LLSKIVLGRTIGFRDIDNDQALESLNCMDMINQTVLPFKLEKTGDSITAHAGLALLGEFTIGVELLEALAKNLPAPGSGVGYRARS